MMSGLKCTGRGAEYPATTLMNLCPVDQRPVEIIIDLERLQKLQSGIGWYHPERRDMWRRQSGGLALWVKEADIHAALSEVWQDKHWWICPEGAACLAALPALVDLGQIEAGDDVVVFNTGSLEKCLPDLRHLLQ